MESGWPFGADDTVQTSRRQESVREAGEAERKPLEVSQGWKKVGLEGGRRDCASGLEPAATSKVPPLQDAAGYRTLGLSNQRPLTCFNQGDGLVRWNLPPRGCVSGCCVRRGIREAGGEAEKPGGKQLQEFRQERTGVLMRQEQWHLRQVKVGSPQEP